MENRINKSEVQSLFKTLFLTSIGIFITLSFDVFKVKQPFGKVFFVLSSISFIAIVWLFIKQVRGKNFLGIKWTKVLRKNKYIHFTFGLLLAFCYCLVIAERQSEKQYICWWYLLSVIVFFIPFVFFKIVDFIIFQLNAKLLSIYIRSAHEIEDASYGPTNLQKRTQLLYQVMKQN